VSSLSWSLAAVVVLVPVGIGAAAKVDKVYRDSTHHGPLSCSKRETRRFSFQPQPVPLVF